MRAEVEPELLIHTNEELNHAVMVVDRITQLGGTPLLSPEEWAKWSRCKYETPSDPYVKTILKQNPDGERCAIKRYQEIADYTKGKDRSTYQMAINILNDEFEHEQEFEDWLNDIDILREDIKKIRM